jgi:hypothetical protein
METIYNSNERAELAGRILQYFGLVETVIEDNIATNPLQFSLEGNYPNPFNPVTTFRFTIPEQGNVNLRIYDMLGRRVTTVINKNMEAGVHTYTYDASRLASGTYIYIIRWNNLQLKGKMQLIR